MDPGDVLFERDFEELRSTDKEYIDVTAKPCSACRRLGIATGCVLVLDAWLLQLPSLGLVELFEEAEWEHQAALAIMDGKPLPPRPGITTPVPSTTPAPTAAPAPGSGPSDFHASVTNYPTPPSESQRPRPHSESPEPRLPELPEPTANLFHRLFVGPVGFRDVRQTFPERSASCAAAACRSSHDESVSFVTTHWTVHGKPHLDCSALFGLSCYFLFGFSLFGTTLGIWYDAQNDVGCKAW